MIHNKFDAALQTCSSMERLSRSIGSLMIGQSGGHIGLTACQFAPLEWRARQLMLDLVGDVLEHVFTMIEMSDGSALLPLATEFLPWANVRMCG